MPGCVLAIDLGGTSLRTGLVDADGNILASAARVHRIGEEVAPEDWWRALAEMLPELKLAQHSVVAIGLTGFTRSQVLMDATGNPVRPAQCFPDGRATQEAAELRDAVAGTWTEMTAYHPLARLLWARRHDPNAFACARCVLQPKDWLGLRLTGRAASDTVANAWVLDRATGHAVPEVLARAGLDPALLPDIVPPETRLGRVCGGIGPAFAALAGVPVFLGSMDAWCATLGAGAMRAGGAYIVSGTSDVAGVFSTAPLTAPGLVTLPWGDRLFHLGGPSQAGADCAAWAAELLGLPDAAALMACAADADPAAEPILFLPYLTGERAPLWQPDARGVFLGLSRAHGKAELARAVLDGVALANRDLLERASDAGASFDTVRICGGGARSDLWCAIRADVLGRVVERALAAEPGLVGAAALAFVGLGHHPTLAVAQAAMARVERRFLPDPARAQRNDALLAQFRRLQDAALPIASSLLQAGAVGTGQGADTRRP
jgi:xylulokinase